MKEYIDKGVLLPDDLVLKSIVDELEKVREQGFLLEGKVQLFVWNTDSNANF